MTCLSETMIFPIAAMQLLHTWFHAQLTQKILKLRLAKQETEDSHIPETQFGQKRAP